MMPLASIGGAKRRAPDTVSNSPSAAMLQPRPAPANVASAAAGVLFVAGVKGISLRWQYEDPQPAVAVAAAAPATFHGRRSIGV